MSQSDQQCTIPMSATQKWVGTEWVVDALGCDVGSLRDLPLLVALCNRVINDLGLSVVGKPVSHQFPSPGGVTAMFLLSESHLACHTYPEHGLATFNLYCCRSREPWPWQEQLLLCLDASEVLVRQIPRGRLSAFVSDPAQVDP